MLRYSLGLVALMGLPFVSPAGAQQKPYTLDEVVELVEGRLTTSRILSRLAEDCIGFRIDGAVERRILAAGGDAELVRGMKEICVIQPVAADPQGSADAPGRSGMSSTAGALLAIPLPGVPLMTRPGPGPLVGVGVIGALGFLGYKAHSAYQDRERPRTVDSSEPPQVADSVFNERALTFAAAWVGQVVLTYYLWDGLGIDEASLSPYVRGGAQGRLNLGLNWTPKFSRKRHRSIPRPDLKHPTMFRGSFAPSPRNAAGWGEWWD